MPLPFSEPLTSAWWWTGTSSCWVTRCPFAVRRLMCFVFPWWTCRAAHKTIMKALKGQPNGAGMSSTVWAIVVLGGVTQHDVHPDNPSLTPTCAPAIILGISRPATIGLASEGMTHGMTKLLSVCQAWSLSDWHLLAQAHPGSGEARDKSQKHMALFPSPPPLYFFLVQKKCRKKEKKNSSKHLVLFVFFLPDSEI